MRTWLILAGAVLIVYGANRWSSAAIQGFGEAPTWSIATLAVGAVLVVVAFFIKDKKAGA